jgi:hypothetical protein
VGKKYEEGKEKREAKKRENNYLRKWWDPPGAGW